MAISKKAAEDHIKALDLIHSDRKLSPDDVDFCFEHFHEGANASTRIVGAHFTPHDLAIDLVANVEASCYVDLFAGIGALARAALDYHHFRRPHVICAEFNPDFVVAGKRLVPEATWIEIDLLNDTALADLSSATAGNSDIAIISNPPYGRRKLESGETIQLEYHAIELGHGLGADLGAFLIPQARCPFIYSGKQSYRETAGDPAYRKFHSRTGLSITMNAGFDTSIYADDWKTVSPSVEIAIVEYPRRIARFNAGHEAESKRGNGDLIAA